MSTSTTPRATMHGRITAVRRLLGVMVLTVLSGLFNATVAQAACQTSLDFTGAVVADTRTLDVSTCSNGVLGGLYTALGINSNDAFPLEASANNTGGNLNITPKSISLAPGPTVLVTPIPGPGFATFTGYSFQITAAGTSSSASLALNYASTSCPIGVCSPTGVYGTTDTAFNISIVNAPATGPTSLLVSAPAGVTAGVPFNFTVTARDAANATVPSYRGTVRFSSTDGVAGLPSDYAFVASDNGTRTFAATLRTAGNRTLTATDTVNASLTGLDSISVGAGPPTSMSSNAGTTPQATQSSTAFTNPLAVTVRDQFNNVVPSVNVTFSAPASGASGRFSNNTTQITAATNASGIASSGLITANATAGGPYTVTATAASVPNVTFSLTNVAAPTITSVTPAKGTTSGGTFVTITGEHFTDATQATVGGISLSSFTLVNATTITGYTGARAAGLSDVVVSVPTGTGTGTGVYTYVAPGTLRAYSVVLNGPSEQPPNNSPGVGAGTVVIDTVAGTMSLTMAFSGLTGLTTSAHIHAATSLPGFGTAGIATTTPTFDGFPASVTSGDYTRTFDMTLAASYNPAFIGGNGGTAASAFTALANGIDGGRAYLNVHSSLFGGGEIRGFLVAAPEPTVTENTATLAANATTLTINGTGFDGVTPAHNTVTFNNGAAGAVTAATTTSLTVSLTTAPAEAGALTAVVANGAGNSGAPTRVATVIPVVTAATTTLQSTATGLVINGFGFSPTPANNVVNFSSGTGTVTAATSTTLTLTSVSGLSPGPLTAQVMTNGQGNGAPVQIANVIGTATHFTVAAPVATTSGTTINVTVTALDALNQVATTYAGTVQFTSSDGLAVLPAAYVFVAGDNGARTVSATLVTAGNQTITATDTVTPSLTGTSATVAVAAIGTTTSLVASPNPSKAGETVTLTATVSGTTGSPTGTVTFLTNGTAIDTRTLAGGVASLTSSSLPTGAQTLTARYNASVSHGASTSSDVNHTVEKGDTSVALVSATPSGKSLPGQLLTFTATVAPVAPATGTPTGSVSFRDGSQELGIVALSGGTATFDIAALTTGDHSITAAYNGSADLLASTSTGIAHSVDPKVGPEVLVNSVTSGAQSRPAMTKLPSGRYVVVWQSNDANGDSLGLFGQVYRPNGTRLGGELSVAPSTAGSVQFPSVAALSNGGFVVLWQRRPTSVGARVEVRGQRFSAAGVRQGIEIVANITTALHHYRPAVAGLDGGGFVAAWLSPATAGAQPRVLLRKYAADGQPSGAPFPAAAGQTDGQYAPDIAALADGGFVVTWAQALADGSPTGVFAQRYNDLAAPRGSLIPVSTDAAVQRHSPVVVGLRGPAGGFVVAWSAEPTNSLTRLDVFHRRFAANGTPATVNALKVNTRLASNQWTPTIAALPSGGYFIAWTSLVQDGSGRGVYGQRYLATGVSDDVEFRINTTTGDHQWQPAAITLSDFAFVAAWTSEHQDGDLGGVFAQRLETQRP